MSLLFYLSLTLKAFHHTALTKPFALSFGLHSPYPFSPLPPHLCIPCIPSMHLPAFIVSLTAFNSALAAHASAPPSLPSNYIHETIWSGPTVVNYLLLISVCNIFLHVLYSRCSRRILSYPCSLQGGLDEMTFAGPFQPKI